MLDGIDLEDKDNVASVTSVIKAVLDGVKVLSLRLNIFLWGLLLRVYGYIDFVLSVKKGVGETYYRETRAAIAHDS